MQLDAQHDGFVSRTYCSYGCWHRHLDKNRLINPQNVPWPMFIYFHTCKQFRNDIFLWSTIFTLKLLNMFDLEWVDLHDFSGNFLHRSPLSTWDSTYHVFCTLFLPLLLMQQHSRFPRKQVSFSSQVQQIINRCFKMFLKSCGVIGFWCIPLTKQQFAKHAIHCCSIHINM